MTKLGGKVFSEDTDKDTAGGQVDSVVAGTNITVDNTDPANPVVASTATGSPTTTQGDIIQRGASADERLAIGTALQILQVNAGATALEYVAAPSGAGTLTTKGDLESFTTVQTRLPVGTNDQVLTADSTAASGVAWKAPGAAPAFEGALVTNTGSQTVNSTTSPLTWDNESYDVGGWHDNGVNPTRLTVPAGVAFVRLTMNCRDTSSVSGQLNATLTKNGAGGSFDGAVTNEIETAGGDAVNATSGALAVVEGDYFEMEIFATTSRTTDAATTNFSIEKVG